MSEIEKLSGGQGLGEEVTNLIFSGNEANAKLASSDSNEAQYALCKHETRVGGKVYGSNIITPENQWT